MIQSPTKNATIERLIYLWQSGEGVCSSRGEKDAKKSSVRYISSCVSFCWRWCKHVQVQSGGEGVLLKGGMDRKMEWKHWQFSGGAHWLVFNIKGTLRAVSVSIPSSVHFSIPFSIPSSIPFSGPVRLLVIPVVKTVNRTSLTHNYKPFIHLGAVHNCQHFHKCINHTLSGEASLKIKKIHTLSGLIFIIFMGIFGTQKKKKLYSFLGGKGFSESVWFVHSWKCWHLLTTPCRLVIYCKTRRSCICERETIRFLRGALRKMKEIKGIPCPSPSLTLKKF